jgi:hypothetical protein
MSYRSHVFIIGPLLSMCRMSIVFSIVPCASCVSRMCCAYVEFGLFDLIACVCSLYLVRNFLPVCPTYSSWHLFHFIWYMPLLLYMSVVLSLGRRWFCNVFLVLYDMRRSVFFNSLVMVFVSLPAYVNVDHFCFSVVLGVVVLLILVFVFMYVCGG